MRPEGQKTARRRADRIAAFKAELAELALEGGLVLTPEQQSRLDNHFQSLFSRYQSEYAVELTDATKRVSWGMRVASLLGAAAFMVATILFLHRVWGSLSVPLQVLVLTAAPVALLLATELARTRGVDTYYVSLLALAAGAAFVLETSALGAVLNLHDSPHILLAWGSVGILLAYAYRVRLILAAGLALLCS